MRGGQLRQVLTLQRRVTSTDAEGSPAEGWVTVTTIRAQIQPVGGRELLMAGQMEVRLSHQVTARYRPDLAQTATTTGAGTGHNMRVLWGVRILDVQLVEDPDGRKRRLELLCLERQV